jgi:hypothetical protein
MSENGLFGELVLTDKLNLGDTAFYDTAPTIISHIRDVPETWLAEPGFVYVGRKGQGLDGYFGNPFERPKNASRGSTLEAFLTYARRRIERDEGYRNRVRDLHGKVLVCFCAPKPCHGHVLAMLARELQESV